MSDSFDSREFYELMYAYRTAPGDRPSLVCDAFDAVREFIRSTPMAGAEPPKPAKTYAQASPYTYSNGLRPPGRLADNQFPPLQVEPPKQGEAALIVISDELLEDIYIEGWNACSLNEKFDSALGVRNIKRTFMEAPRDVVQFAVATSPSVEPPPSTDLNDWRIDHSAGRPILVYKDCSVLEAEQAYYVMSLLKGSTIAEAFEAGRKQGMVQERALWELAQSTQEIEAGWQPIETAPKDGSKILVSWPMRELDEDDAPTGPITSRHTFVTWMNGGCWIEPDYLGASGAWFGDDDSFTADPDLWMPLSSAPKEPNP